MNRPIRYWLPVLIWLALIYFFSTDILHGGLTHRVVRAVLLSFFPDISPQTIALVHGGIRKLAHILEYLVLTILLYRGFRQDSSQEEHSRFAMLSLVGAVAVAGLDEFHQGLEPRRVGSFRDVGFDVAGVLMAQAVLWWQCRSHPKKDLPTASHQKAVGAP